MIAGPDIVPTARDMGKTWARHGQDMGKTWARHGQDMGKTWARHGKTCELNVAVDVCDYVIFFLFLSTNVKNNFEKTIEQLNTYLSYLHSFSHGTPKLPDLIPDPRSVIQRDATGAQQFALRCRRHSGIGSTSGHSADGGAGRRTGRRSVDVSSPNRRLFCLLKIYIFYLYGIWYTYGI